MKKFIVLFFLAVFIQAASGEESGVSVKMSGDTNFSPTQYDYVFFNLSLFPPVSTQGWSIGKHIINSIQCGVFLSHSSKLYGFGTSLVTITDEEMTGFEISGFNYTGVSAQGVQFALLINSDAQRFAGFQIAPLNIINEWGEGFQLGIVNINSGFFGGFQIGAVNINVDKFTGMNVGLINIGNKFHGVMVGIINFSLDPEVVPIGLLNIIAGGLLSIETWVDLNCFSFTGLKLGSKYFYTVLTLLKFDFFRGITYLPSTKNIGIGCGLTIPLESFKAGFDFSYETYLNNFSYSRTNLFGGWDTWYLYIHLLYFRLFTGYEVIKNLWIKAGLSYTYYLFSDVPNLSWFPESDQYKSAFGTFIGLEFNFF
ncbi:MAG: hypothetical protein A2014_08265 [Spirochaetes bacterium GWF1_49_6]|nr:MAG: hypothetical protein A2014_08265 [Spirochaetes bacterium GWF1_49_6]